MKAIDKIKATAVIKRLNTDIQTLIKERAQQVDAFAKEHSNKKNYNQLKQEELLPALRNELLKGAGAILKTAMQEYGFQVSDEMVDFANVDFLVQNREAIKSKLVTNGANGEDVDKMMDIVSDYSKKIKELSGGMEEIATLLLDEDSKLGTHVTLKKCAGAALAVLTAAFLGGIVASIGLTAIGVATGASFASFAVPFALTLVSVGFWPVSVFSTAGLVIATDSLVTADRGSSSIITENITNIEEKIDNLTELTNNFSESQLETVRTNLETVNANLKDAASALETVIQPDQLQR